MTDVIIPDGVMSMADFIARGERENFELIDGKVVPLSPTVSGHDHITDDLAWELNLLVRPSQLGRVRTEGTYVIELRPDWVKGSRVPDLAFYAGARYYPYIAETPDWESQPFTLIPDWTIEILSEDNTPKQIERKIQIYFEDGVRLVWVINRWTRSLTVYTPDDEAQLYEGDAVVTGAPVLPEFSLVLSSLFAW